MLIELAMRGEKKEMRQLETHTKLLLPIFSNSVWGLEMVCQNSHVRGEILEITSNASVLPVTLVSSYNNF